MPPLPDLSLFSLWAFGVGGLLAGLLGLLAQRRQSPGSRGPGLAPALLALTVLGVCSATTGRPAGLDWPPLALAALLLLFTVARSNRLAAAVAAVLTWARAPRWQWAALAVACPAAAGLLGFAVSRQTVERPPPRPRPPCTAVTDLGRDVFVSEAVGGPGPADVLQAAEARKLREQDLEARVIQVAPADWTYNCHGWIFTGGHYLVPDAPVELILRDNGYRPVEQPAVGDLAIYRNEQGSICHSARVWAVGEGGQVLLESKWAWMGRYLHPPDATPYGRDWTYYHSPRRGHRLHGPGGVPQDSSPPSPAPDEEIRIGE